MQRWDGRDEQIATLLEGIDVLFAIERTVPDDLFQRARQRGIRCVLAVNAEWFDPGRPWFRGADALVARTPEAYDLIRSQSATPVTYVPCPVDPEEFPFVPRDTVRRMVYSDGWGGVHERKGWPEIAALLSCDPTLPLTVCTQRQTLPQLALAPQIRGPSARPADLYTDFDLAVQPSRFEGVGLAILEAMACGLPVLTTDAPPMRHYIRAACPDMAERLLVPADRADVQIWERTVPAYRVRVPALLERVRWWSGRECRDVSHAVRAYIEREHGWDAWQRLSEVIAG